MAPPSGPGVSRRVVVWSTAELAALDLPAMLTPRGFEFACCRGRRQLHVADAVTKNWNDGPPPPTSASQPAPGRPRRLAPIALYATPYTGRLTSLLPTAHITLVRPSQIVRTIPEGLALLADYAAHEGGFPSAVNLVSGPSRTGDIEGDLAVGAHGPSARRSDHRGLVSSGSADPRLLRSTSKQQPRRPRCSPSTSTH